MAVNYWCGVILEYVCVCVCVDVKIQCIYCMYAVRLE